LSSYILNKINSNTHHFTLIQKKIKTFAQQFTAVKQALPSFAQQFTAVKQALPSFAQQLAAVKKAPVFPLALEFYSKEKRPRCSFKKISHSSSLL
jgi:hypothetical protein